MATIPRASRTPRQVPPTPTVAGKEPDSAPSDFLLAAIAVFDGGSNTYVTRSGQSVTIRPATMAQLPQIMSFFSGVMAGVDPSSLALLVDSVVHAQKMAIAQGADPNNIDLRELATDELVGKVLGQGSLLSMLFASVFELLPGLIESFTDMKEAEFRALEIDEGMLIAGGIFLLNYRFFSQSLPPLLTAYVRSWQSKRAVTSPATGPAGKTKSTK